MLHFDGWSLSKGVQNNKKGFRQGRLFPRGWPRCCLAITDADMFENGKVMESDIVTCIKNLPSRENCSFKFQCCPKVCLSKAEFIKVQESKISTAHYPC